MLNRKLAKLEQFIKEARRILEELKNKLKQWREQNEKRRSIGTNHDVSGNGATDNRVSGIAERSDGRIETRQRIEESVQQLEN